MGNRKRKDRQTIKTRVADCAICGEPLPPDIAFVRKSHEACFARRWQRLLGLAAAMGTNIPPSAARGLD